MKNTPEYKLWMQVMRQGLFDLRMALDAIERGRSTYNSEGIDLRELAHWIFMSKGPGSFGWLCELLGIDVNRLRRTIRGYWTRRLRGEYAELKLGHPVLHNGRIRIATARRFARARKGARDYPALVA